MSSMQQQRSASANRPPPGTASGAAAAKRRLTRANKRMVLRGRRISHCRCCAKPRSQRVDNGRYSKSSGCQRDCCTNQSPRLFATNTTTKSGSTSKRTRRRKNLAVSNTANTSMTTTTKDRLRTVIDQNKVKATLLPTRDQASDVLNLAQSRVTWVRDKVYEFWGADAKGGSSSSAAARAAVPNRPVKKDINMDARWWLWNILFALVPALAIGIYCEFRGQKLMHKYYTGWETEQMRRILGENAVLDEWVVPPPENFVVRIVRFGR
jgi:hypothetical protein